MADTTLDAAAAELPRQDVTPPLPPTDLDHHQRQHPHAYPHHARHKPDPFLDLDTNVAVLPAASKDGKDDVTSQESPKSLLVDLIMVPLNMITFVLSLSMVEYRHRQWRLSQHLHSPTSDTIWSRMAHWASFHPEPYQDSRDSTWKHKNDTNVGDAPAATFQGWSTRKKHRAMAKMEISDALEMKGRFLIALLALSTLGLLALVYMVKRMYGWILGG